MAGRAEEHKMIANGVSYLFKGHKNSQNKSDIPWRIAGACLSVSIVPHHHTIGCRSGGDAIAEDL